MATFLELLAGSGVTPAALAQHLDGLTHAQRLAETLPISGKDQARLYDLVAGAVPITLEHFVPPGVPDMTEVIHHGKNSLPLFTAFQKRFCRPAGSKDRLYGYNEQTMRGVTGPGYFVVHPVAAEKRVVIDYREVPPAHPEGWPEIQDNGRLFSRLVYFGMQDFMWKVSEHVSIGRAFKNDKWQPNWFLLCREDR